MIALSREQGFAQWLSQGTVVHGWALTALGQSAEGIAQMHEAMAAYRATGSEISRPYYLALLAEAYGAGGQAQEGLEVLAEAVAIASKNGPHYWDAELHRQKGELLRALSASHTDEAVTCLQQALAVARRQQAKSLELRAATSLARLWQQQGKHAEAHALLAPIYGWCTEGFDTVDLREARALLRELQP